MIRYVQADANDTYDVLFDEPDPALGRFSAAAVLGLVLVDAEAA